MANSVLDYMNSKQSKNQESANNAKKQIQEIMEKLQSGGAASSQAENESQEDYYNRRYREAANAAASVKWTKDRDSIARGQAILDAQRERDAKAEAQNAHTASELDLAHGILPATSNAQAFANQHGRSSLDDAVDQIAGNNVLSQQGKVNRIGEEVQNRFGNQTEPEINDKYDLGRAIRSEVSQNRQTNTAINNAIGRYVDRQERQKRIEEAQKVGKQGIIDALTLEDKRLREERERRKAERDNDPERKKLLDERGELVDRLYYINRDLEADAFHTGLFPELEAEKAEVEKRIAEYDQMLGFAEQEQEDALLTSQMVENSLLLDKAVAARYTALQGASDFKEKSKYKWDRPDDDFSNRINGLNPKEFGDINSENFDVGKAAEYNYKQSTSGDTEDYLDQFTNEERDTYNYILNTAGTDEARKYAEFLRPELEKRATDAAAKEAYEYAHDNAFNAIISAGASIIASPLRAQGTFGAIADAFQGKDISPNAYYNRPSVLIGAAREGVNKQLEENVTGLLKHWGASEETAKAVGSKAAWLNQGVLSSLDSAWNAFLGQQLVGFLGMDVQGAREILDTAKLGLNVDAATLANAERVMNFAENTTRIIMSAEVVPDAIRNAKERGYTDDQAMAVGLVSGFAEWFSEAYSIGNLFETDWTKKGVKNFLINQLKQRGFEGLEEIESNVIDTFADALIAKDKSEWQEAVDKYTKELGKDRAVGAALLEKTGEALSDFMSAFLTTGNEVFIEAGKQYAYNKAVRGTHEAVSDADRKKGTKYQQSIDASIQAAMNKPEEEWASDLADAVNGMRGAYNSNTVNHTIDYLREAARTATDGISAANYTAMAEYLSKNKKAVWQLAEERNGTAKQTAQNVQNTQTETAPEQSAPSTETAEPSTEPSTAETTPSTESTTATETETEPVRQATARERREEARRQKRIAQIQSQLDRNPNASVDAETMALQEELRTLQEESERFADSLEGYEGDYEADESAEPLSWAEQHRRLRHSDQAADQPTQTEQAVSVEQRTASETQTLPQTQAAPQSVSHTSENAPVAENTVETENNTVAENEAQRGFTEAGEDGRTTFLRALNVSEEATDAEIAQSLLNSVDKKRFGNRFSGLKNTAANNMADTLNRMRQSGQYTPEQIEAARQTAVAVDRELLNLTSEAGAQKLVNAGNAALKKAGIKAKIVVDNVAARDYKGDVTARGSYKDSDGTIHISPYLDTNEAIYGVIAHEMFHKAADGSERAQLVDDILAARSAILNASDSRRYGISRATRSVIGNASMGDFVETYADLLMHDFGMTDEGMSALKAKLGANPGMDGATALKQLCDENEEAFWQMFRDSDSLGTAQNYMKEEVAAHFFEELGSQHGEAIMRELMRNDRNLFERIIDAVRRYFHRNDPDYEKNETYNRIMNAYERIAAEEAGLDARKLKGTAAQKDTPGMKAARAYLGGRIRNENGEFVRDNDPNIKKPSADNDPTKTAEIAAKSIARIEAERAKQNRSYKEQQFDLIQSSVTDENESWIHSPEDIRYSLAVSTEQDQEYMDAVESGDEETIRNVLNRIANGYGYYQAGDYYINTTPVESYDRNGKKYYKYRVGVDPKGYHTEIIVGNNNAVVIKGWPTFRDAQAHTLSQLESVLTAKFTPSIGHFVRSTNNKSEINLAKSGKLRPSINHRDGYSEKGVSVADNYAYAVNGEYSYSYYVDGDVIGHGSDGEPLLDPKTIKVVGKLMDFTTAKKEFNKSNQDTTEMLHKFGWTDEAFDALASSYRSYMYLDEHVISSDLIMRDNAGKVIPPSQRFNPDRSDIRESRMLKSESDYEQALAEEREKRDFLTKQFVGRNSFGYAKALDKTKHDAIVKRYTDLFGEDIPADEINRVIREFERIMERPKRDANDTAEARMEEAWAYLEQQVRGWVERTSYENVLKETIGDEGTLEGLVALRTALRDPDDPGYYYIKPDMVTAAGSNDAWNETRRQLNGVKLKGFATQAEAEASGRKPISELFTKLISDGGAYNDLFTPDETASDYEKLSQIANMYALSKETESPYERRALGEYDNSGEVNAIVNDIMYAWEEAAEITKMGKAMQKADERFEASYDRLRRSYERKLDRAGERYDKLQNRIKGKDIKRAQRMVLGRIAKDISALDKLQNHPSKEKNKYIPQRLLGTVAKVREAVQNFANRSGKTIDPARLTELQQSAMDETQNFMEGLGQGLKSVGSATEANARQDPNITDVFIRQADNLIQQLRDLRADIEENHPARPTVDENGKRITPTSEMIAEDNAREEAMYEYFNTVRQLLDMTLQAIRNEGKMILNGRTQDLREVSQLLASDLKQHRQKDVSLKHRNLGSETGNWFQTGTFGLMSADAALERLGDNWHSFIARSVREGQNRQMKHQADFSDFMRETIGNYDITKGGFYGDYVTLERPTGKVDKNGKPITESFKVTRNELMSLYALWNRPAGRLHLENGGGTFINQNGQAFHDNNVVLTDELVKEYTDHLTDQEKEIVDKVVDYLSHEASKWGNDVSMYVYGYRLFNEDSYFPMEVADYANKRSFADPTMPGSGLNPGFTQALTRSKKPLAIRDFFDVVNDHIIGMSNYNAYGAAAHDLDRILNSSLKDGGKETSMLELLRKTYGNSAVNYLTGFVQKLAGTKHNDPSILDTLRTMGYLSGNLYKRAAVSWNLSTAAKQPLSIIRAANEIDPKYLIFRKPMSPAEYRAAKEKMESLSGIAKIKSLGYSDTGHAKSLQATYDDKYFSDSNFIRRGLGSNKAARGAFRFSDKFTEAGMYLAGKADEMTWVNIWDAVTHEVMDKYPNLTGDDLDAKITERFNEVIGLTQVVDSILDSAPVIQEKTFSLLFPFMNEPVKSASNIILAASKFNQPGGKKKFAKAMGLQLLSAVLLEPLVTTLASMWRDEKDDIGNGFWDHFLEKMFGIKKDEDGDGKSDTNFESIITSNAFAGIWSMPFVTQLYDTISNAVQDYDNTSIDKAAVVDLVKAYQNLRKYSGASNGDSAKTQNRLWREFAESFASVLGVPAKTIRRQISGTARMIMNATDDDELKWEYNKLSYNLENKNARSQKGFYDILAHAYATGDMESYEKFRKELNDIVTDNSTLLDVNTIVKNIEKRGGNVQPGDPLWNVEVQARFRLDTPVKGWHNENFLTGVYKQAEAAGIKDDECKKVLYSLPDKYEPEDENGDDIEMSPAEYDQFASDCGDLAYKLVSQLSSAGNAKAWSELSIDQKLYAIEKAYDYSKRKFRKDINPELNITGMGKKLVEVYETSPMDTSKIIAAVMDMAAGYKGEKDRKKK